MISEFLRIQLDHAWCAIESAEINIEDKETLQDFLSGFDDPMYEQEIEANLVFLYRLLGDMQLRQQHNQMVKRRKTIARKAALAKAERHQAIDPHAWMVPYFERAYAALEADGYAQIGRRKLSHHAKRLARQAGLETSRRRDISERRAEAFLKQRQNELM